MSVPLKPNGKSLAKATEESLKKFMDKEIEINVSLVKLELASIKTYWITLLEGLIAF